MVGEAAAPRSPTGIPLRFVEPTGDVAQQLIEAEMSYVAYVKDQAGSLFGEGFSTYDELSTAEVQALAAAVDAVGEPLSRLTTTITGAG